MHRVEIRNVEAVVEKPIKDGRIIGLTKWNGKTAKVVILKGQEAHSE